MNILVPRGPGATAEQPGSRQLGERSPKPSAIELLSEVSDLAAGVGLLIFVHAPFALPGLALAAVAIVLLLIPLLIGAILTAPILVVRRWQHSRDHAIAAETCCEHQATGASNTRASVAVESRRPRPAPAGFLAGPRLGRAASRPPGPSR